MTYDEDTQGTWPPGPEDVWVALGSMSAPIDGIGPGGATRAVLVRLGSVRNGTDGEVGDDRTYLLDDERLAGLLMGLIETGHAAFGQRALQAIMARALGIPDDLRDASLAAVDEAVGKVERRFTPPWLQDDEDDGYRIVDRD